MKDPDFLAAVIGWAVGFAMNELLHRIYIVYCFQERLAHFQSHGPYLRQLISPSCTIGMKKLLGKRLIERAFDIVNNGSKVPWFNVKKRYQLSKSIPKLILRIHDAMSLFHFQSVVMKPSHERTTKSPPPPPLALGKPPAPPVFGALSQPRPAFSAPPPPPVFWPPSSPPPTEDETPSQALPAETAEEVDSTNHNGLDFSIKKKSKYLEHLLRNINPTMEMVEKTFPRRDNTDSAVGWYELLRKLLKEANDSIDHQDKTYTIHIYRRYKCGKRIQHSVSHINAHLRLFPLLEMMPASSNDPGNLFSNNPSGSEG
jgi:hypothetical protein